MKNAVLFFFLVFQAFFSVVRAEELPENSTYQISTKWINQEGGQVALSDFRGRPVIFSMVYLSCKFTCPTVVSEIQNIISKLNPKAKEQVKAVLVSFDPKRDTPEEMKKFLKKRNLDAKVWNFLTSKDERKIRELAATINFKYKKDDTGEFTHSFIVAVLDENGVLKVKLDGANQSKEALVNEIHKISKNLVP